MANIIANGGGNFAIIGIGEGNSATPSGVNLMDDGYEVMFRVSDNEMRVRKLGSGS